MLREKSLPYRREHADYSERQFGQHPPDPLDVTLCLANDMVLYSSNWVRWQLGRPLPVDCGDRAR